jgi:transcriptional regulator with XRE-family HTH domain
MDQIEMRPFALKALRTRLGWPQIEMARLLGCSLAQVVNWERESLVPADLFRDKLCRLEAEADLATSRTQLVPRAEHLAGVGGLSQLQYSGVEELELKRAA